MPIRAIEHRADAPEARANRLLFDDAENSQLAGALDMRATADLLAEIADRVDLDALAVALVEQADRARALRVAEAHLGPRDRQVAADLLVHQRLDRCELLGRELLGVHEVETQPLCRDVAAAL